MRRKPKRASPENHERWLVSYADFITLLFAFFVVMFAASQTDNSRVKQLSEAVNEAFATDKFTSRVTHILGGSQLDQGRGSAQMRGPGGVEKSQGTEAESRFAELLPSLRRLTTELKDEITSRKIEVSLQPRGLVISLKQAAFFPSGEDTIASDTYAAIGKVAEVIGRLPNPVRLEGHTDSVPIHNSRFRNNWELSAARSIAMLQVLEERFSIARQRMAVYGYAETFPIGDNSTESGRAQNRRVDIVVMNQRAVLAEPDRFREGPVR